MAIFSFNVINLRVSEIKKLDTKTRKFSPYIEYTTQNQMYTIGFIRKENLAVEALPSWN